MISYTTLKVYNSKLANILVGAALLLSLFSILVWVVLYRMFPHLNVAFAFLTFPLVFLNYGIYSLLDALMRHLTISFHPHPVTLTLEVPNNE